MAFTFSPPATNYQNYLPPSFSAILVHNYCTFRLQCNGVSRQDHLSTSFSLSPTKRRRPPLLQANSRCTKLPLWSALKGKVESYWIKRKRDAGALPGANKNCLNAYNSPERTLFHRGSVPTRSPIGSLLLWISPGQWNLFNRMSAIIRNKLRLILKVILNTKYIFFIRMIFILKA